MGRLRIKKKDAVIPFRQTLAYRTIMLMASIFLFLFSLYVMYGALASNTTVSFIIGAVLGVGSAFMIFSNLRHLKDARIPSRTLKKMKYR